MALRISEDGELDFDAPDPEELLELARESGYSARVVQALFAVEDADGCEIVEKWNRGLGPSDVYRRHEARDAGIGTGFLDDMSVYVLLVGVPPSPDPTRKRAAGVAPREYPIDDLLRLVERQRRVGGLPELRRSPQLDAAAQETAARLLYDPGVAPGRGRVERPDGTVVVYAKVSQNLVYDMAESVKAWFQFYREDLLRRGSEAVVGGGIATRGTDAHIEGVLAVAIGRD
jgi:hypothetical protein